MTVGPDPVGGQALHRRPTGTARPAGRRRLGNSVSVGLNDFSEAPIVEPSGVVRSHLPALSRVESSGSREVAASLTLGVASLAWYWVAAFLGGLTGGRHWAVWFTLVLVWPLIGTAAVITGFMARHRMKLSGLTRSAQAVAGIVMGSIAIGAFLLFLGHLMLVEILTHLH